MMRLYYLANVAQSQPNTGNLLIRQMRRTVKLLEYLSPLIRSDTEAIIRNGQFHPLLIPKHYDIDIHFLSRIFDRILYQVRQDIRHMYGSAVRSGISGGKAVEKETFFPAGILVRRTTFSTNSRRLKAEGLRSVSRSSAQTYLSIFPDRRKDYPTRTWSLEGPVPSWLIHPHLPVIQERDEYLQGLYRSPQLMDHRMHEPLTQLVQAHLLPDRTDLETQASQQ